MGHGVVGFRVQGQKLADHRALGHRVDELVAGDEKPIDLAFLVRIEHDLDAADEIRKRRILAHIVHGRDDVAANRAEKRRRLVADEAQVDLHALGMPVRHVAHQGAEQVDVEAAAEPFVGGDHEVADAADLAGLHVDVPVLGVGVREMANHRANLLRVGLAFPHPLLGAAHLARRHHLHRARNLLGVLDAADLLLDLFADRHIRRL